MGQIRGPYEKSRPAPDSDIGSSPARSLRDVSQLPQDSSAYGTDIYSQDFPFAGLPDCYPFTSKGRQRNTITSNNRA